MNLIHHDIVNTPTDRAKMNRHILEAQRPGGRCVVIDTSARPGSGVSAIESLHRIDEEVVREVVPRAAERR
jgi:predicted methyltransferase